MLKRIAHITDTHMGDETALDRGADPKANLEAILEDIPGNADDIIVTGDLGAKDTLPWLFDKLASYNSGFKITLGNHDSFSEVMELYKNSQPVSSDELYYTQEDEFYKYLYMDSSSGTISNSQLEWLRQEINTLKKIIVFIHHPILGFETGMDKTYPLQNRELVNEILQQSRNDVTVFCGHYHMPDRRTVGKVTQYITPSVAFQVNKNAQTIEINTNSFAYRLITIDENSIHTKLVTNFYDYFTKKTG
jgi:Icc protein